MNHEAKEMLQKARQPKHGGHESILARRHKYNDYQKSLSKIGWTEEHIIQYDKLAPEDHSYIATPKERVRNEKNWVLSLNKEGVQGPMNQRPDFAEAKQILKRLHDKYVTETSEENTPNYPTQRTRQRRDQQLEGLEEYDYQDDLQIGWRTYPSRSRRNLRHPTSSSSSTQWEQHDDWSKSWNFLRSSSWTEQ